jgi:hypothetical protein
MTDDKSIRDKLSSLTNRSAARDDEESLEDLGVCGWLHGIRDRALYLELRLKTGNTIALGYAWLEQAAFDPSEGITLQFAGCCVKLQGQHLEQPLKSHATVYDGFLRHRIPWVQETDRSSQHSHDGKPMITKIIIK